MDGEAAMLPLLIVEKAAIPNPVYIEKVVNVCLMREDAVGKPKTNCF
jgi:hypothetical protein